MRNRNTLLLAILIIGLPFAAASAQQYTTHSLALANPPVQGGLAMDYIAYDRATGMVWAPVSNTGTVYVVDSKTEDIKKIDSLPTKEVDFRGTKRTVGTTAAEVGDHVVYVGNRGDQSVCAFDAISFVKVACGQLDSTPDGVAYVAPTKEVWVTTPRDKSIRILDAKTLAQKEKLSFEGNPEGFTVDAKRHRFYTNLEDKDRTLGIDLKTHKTVSTWNPGCGQEGPHGLHADATRRQVFVVCDAKLEVFDSEGRIASSVDTGDGVDDFAYDPETHTAYVGAAKDAKLTIVSADAKGKLTIVAQVPTEKGARNPVVTKSGTVYLAHSGNANLNDLFVVVPSK
jgi:DNA-binding beta-propeller fold protein YncE